MIDKTGKITTKAIVLILLLFLLSIILITIGIYLSKKSYSKEVLSNTISTTENTLLDVVTPNTDFNFNDKFTIESTLSSNNVSETTTTNEFINNINKILTNLSKLNINTKLVVDKNNKKALFSCKSTKSDQEYLNFKYYIKDSTRYYYNPSIYNNYINVGSNNFFETVSKDTTTNDNIEVINNTIKESLINHIDELYLSKSKEKVTYNNNQIDSNKYTISLNNNQINRLIRLILKDLKNNKKTSTILNNYYTDFNKLKLKNNIEILNNNEYITIDIYTTTIKNNLLKIDFKYVTKEKEYRISKEILSSKENIYYSENGLNIYNFKLNKKSNTSYTLKVYNSNNKKIGKGSYTFNNNQKLINLTIVDNKNRIELNYNSKNKNNEITSNIILKYIENNKSIINYKGNINIKISKNTKILEDTTKSVLKSSLTKEQIELFNNYYINIKKDILGE